MLRRLTVIAVLIALVAASFPTMGVLAKGPRVDKLEAKWDDLTTIYKTQSFGHLKIHQEVDHWLKTNTQATVSDKAKVAVHLHTCNTAFESAQALVKAHAGFDSKGKVVDIAVATKTVKGLNMYLQQHAMSIKNLQGHII